MKVYEVEGHYNYGGGTLLGEFTTKELAEDFKEKLSHSYDWITVEEYILDESN